MNATFPRAVAACCVSLVFAPTRVTAQAAAPPGLSETFVVRADEQFGLAMRGTAAQTRAALAGADQLLAIVRRAGALAHSADFITVVHRATGSAYPGFDAGMPFHYGVVGGLNFIQDGASIPVSVVANMATCGEANDPAALDSGPPVMTGYRRTGEFRGHPVYNGECVFITDRAAPPLVPVTKERFIRLAVLKLRARQAAQRESNRAGGATAVSGALAQFLKERPQREADMRKTYNEVKAQNPAAAEQMLVAWKKSEADAEQKLRGVNADSADRALVAAEQLGDSGISQRIRELEAELAAMPALERRAPAAVVNADQLTPSNVTDDGAMPLVQPNPAFFDRRLAPEVPQLIVVVLPGVQPDVEVTRVPWNAQRARSVAQITAQLDWAGFETMVTLTPHGGSSR